MNGLEPGRRHSITKSSNDGGYKQNTLFPMDDLLIPMYRE